MAYPAWQYTCIVTQVYDITTRASGSDTLESRCTHRGDCSPH